jgi:urea transport system substrate-binding protein
MKLDRRSFLTLLGTGLGLSSLAPIARSQSMIKVGILHSLSGTMAVSEKSAVDAELLAIEEINKSGGIFGQQIEAIIEDGDSDWVTFAEKAKKLIEQDRVTTIFGCWTSASRKSCLSVIEPRDHILWYPMTYEGQECSKNIFYTGSIPNQQIEPTINWLSKTFPQRPIFFIGSDYVYPRVVAVVMREQLGSVKLAGKEYIPLGQVNDFPSIVRQIQRSMPRGGVIFNALNGDSNVAFFKELQILNRKRYPVVSIGIMEEEILAIGTEYLTNHYVAQSYFQTVNTAANRRFVSAFKAKYGSDRILNDAMAAAYTAVYLWKQAVEKAGTATDLDRVRQAARNLVITAPEGRIKMNTNHHMSRFARVGKIRADGQIETVYQSKTPIAPQPWNQMIRETKNFACDWSNPNRGGKFRL